MGIFPGSRTVPENRWNGINCRTFVFEVLKIMMERGVLYRRDLGYIEAWVNEASRQTEKQFYQPINRRAESYKRTI